jgi:chromate transporter
VEKPRILSIFFAFLRLGAGAFGGPAMVVYIRELSVRRKEWLDEKTFNDGVALCQSIPGATAIQTAAYVGLRSRGVMGALLSYVGFGLPAFIFMLTLSYLYLRYHHLQTVIALFAILQVIVVAIIANATILLGKGLVRQPINIALAVISAVLFGINVSPFLVIVGGGAVGALLLRPRGPHVEPGSTGVLFHGKPVLIFLGLIAAGLAAAWFVNPKLFQIALTMLKVDCFAFGGGFAALPLMLHEVVNVMGWLTGPVFMDGIALGQITPGPIVITATFVGFLTAGLAGAVVATCAIFSPSFVVLLIAAPIFDRLKSSPIFTGAIKGVFATFLGLLIFMTVKFGLLVPWDAVRVGVGLLAFGALLRKVDTFYIVLGGAVLSFILFR